MLTSAPKGVGRLGGVVSHFCVLGLAGGDAAEQKLLAEAKSDRIEPALLHLEVELLVAAVWPAAQPAHEPDDEIAAAPAAHPELRLEFDVNVDVDIDQPVEPAAEPALLLVFPLVGEAVWHMS